MRSKNHEGSPRRKGGHRESTTAPDYLNRTVPNLSSIVVPAEAKVPRVQSNA
jgi:hypothetical protein